MKIKVLGCYGGQMPGKNNTALLLDSDTLIDAGTIALASDIKEQRKIKNILLSHAHLDHVGALPFYGVNIVSNKSKSVNLYGSAATLGAVKKYVFNNIVWPDFSKIKNFGGNNIFKYCSVKQNKWIKVGKYRVKAVSVNHTIPTNGFIIGSGNKYVLYSGDTKDTSAIWKEAKKILRFFRQLQ